MKIKLLEGAKAPKKANMCAAGYDLYTQHDFIVQPGRNIVPTGVIFALDPGYEGHIRPRSGFSCRGIEGYPIRNGKPIFDIAPRRFDADVIQGTLDSDYRNAVGIIVNNHSQAPFCIKGGTRLAQIVIEQCYMGEFVIVDSLDETERGEGGFGSSGVM